MTEDVKMIASLNAPLKIILKSTIKQKTKQKFCIKESTGLQNLRGSDIGGKGSVQIIKMEI